MDALPDLKEYIPNHRYMCATNAVDTNSRSIGNSNNKSETTNSNNDIMTYLSSDYNTLKQLLQSSQSQQLLTKNALSPNGNFKYVDRESVKGTAKKYNSYSKSTANTRDRIRRPLNCFMVFSHLERKRVAEEHPELHNADLSKILGKRWKNLTAVERQPYIDEAERIRLLHTEIYPDYKYQPKRKIQNTGKRMQKKIEGETAKSETKQENDVGQETKSKFPHDVKTSDKSNCDASPSQCQISSKSFEGEKKSSHVPVKEDFLPSCKGMEKPINQTQSDDNQVFPNTFTRYPSNSSCAQLTPDLSPVSCYKEPIFNATPTARMCRVQSLPPTPEISPKAMNRDDPVFCFDPRNVNSDYPPPHSLKPVNYPQASLLCSVNGNKDDVMSNQNYYTQTDAISQMQCNNNYYHGNTLQQAYFQPQQMFNNRNFQLNPNQMDSMDQMYMNNNMGYNNMNFNGNFGTLS